MIGKIPRPINFQIKHCLLAPILSLVIKGLTWRLLPPVFICPVLKGLSQSSPPGCYCLCVSWCSSQLACHVSKHALSRAEYAQTCLSDICNCTVASLSHLLRKCLCKMLCGLVCMCTPVFVLVFAYAVHLITSLLLLCREYSFQRSTLTFCPVKTELVCGTECKLTGSNMLMIHFGCREGSKWH